MNDPAYWAMFASLVFLAFLLFQVRVSLGGRTHGRAEAKKRLAEANRRARAAAGDPKARAKELRVAAKIALEDLARPALAASLARRADRIDPDSAASVDTLVAAMTAAGRFHALERLLWKHVDESPPGSDTHERSFDALLVLYDGPMRRRHQASALRRLRGR